MTLKSDDVSTRFDSLFGEKLVGTRHARSPLTSSRSQTCRWGRIARAKPTSCFSNNNNNNNNPEPRVERGAPQNERRERT